MNVSQTTKWQQQYLTITNDCLTDYGVRLTKLRTVPDFLATYSGGRCSLANRWMKVFKQKFEVVAAVVCHLTSQSKSSQPVGGHALPQFDSTNKIFQVFVHEKNCPTTFWCHSRTRTEAMSRKTFFINFVEGDDDIVDGEHLLFFN